MEDKKEELETTTKLYMELWWQNYKVCQFMQSYGLKTNKKLCSDQTGNNNNWFDWIKDLKHICIHIAHIYISFA